MVHLDDAGLEMPRGEPGEPHACTQFEYAAPLQRSDFRKCIGKHHGAIPQQQPIGKVIEVIGRRQQAVLILDRVDQPGSPGGGQRIAVKVNARQPFLDRQRRVLLAHLVFWI